MLRMLDNQVTKRIYVAGLEALTRKWQKRRQGFYIMVRSWRFILRQRGAVEVF